MKNDKILTTARHYLNFRLVGMFGSVLAVSGCGGGGGGAPKFCQLSSSRFANLTGGLQIDADGRGVLGIMVHDRETGMPLALTNCHVVDRVNGCTKEFTNPVRLVDQPRIPSIGYASKGVNTGNNSSLEDWAIVPVSQRGYTYDGQLDPAEQMPTVIGGPLFGAGQFNLSNQIVYFEQYLNRPGKVLIGIPLGVAGQGRTFDWTSNPPGMGTATQGDSGTVVLDAMTKQPVGLLRGGPSDLKGSAQVFSDVLKQSSSKYYDPKLYPVSFFRYKTNRSSNPINFLYTADWGELGISSDGFDFESRQGAMFREKNESNLQPFHRYASNNDYLYSTELEHGMGDSEYCYIGVTGWLPDQTNPGNATNKLLTRLYRYKNNNNQHFYTIKPSEAEAGGWVPDVQPGQTGYYWVYAEDGDPDPQYLYQGPADARISIDAGCSTARLTVQGNKGETRVSGDIDLTIGPECKDPVCALSVASMKLLGADFSLAGKQVSGATIANSGYALGSWKPDDTYVLPNQSTTVRANLSIDGNSINLTANNGAKPIYGNLKRDYSGFTMEADFDNGDMALHLSLCGHVVAHPPVALVTPPGPFQCDSINGAHVTFSSEQSHDPDNDIAHRRWELDNVYASTDVVTLPATLALGSHSVSVAVSDSRGAISTASQTVQVVDTTPPQLHPSVTQGCLWPPNHKYVLYTIGDGVSTGASDICDSTPTVQVTKVTSNQPPTGGGSGSTAQDVQFGSHGFCVRAERDGTVMTPREYTVTLGATDRTGNKTSQQIVISVPHDQSGGTNCKIDNKMVVDDNDPRCTQ